MKKLFIVLIAIVAVFTTTACGSKDSKKESQNINNTTTPEKKEEKTTIPEKKETVQDDDVIIDDEIIDIDEEDNVPLKDEIVSVEKVINCDNCVYAYFSDEGDNAKKIGDTLLDDEYTTDINKIKTNGGKQRHNFFGLVLNENKISRAYACILKDNTIYCLEGSTNGAYHSNNISVLNKVFTANQCRTISDGHTYTCTDGYYNGDTQTSGYTSMHYETSCTIYGKNANTGKLICH